MIPRMDNEVRLVTVFKIIYNHIPYICIFPYIPFRPIIWTFLEVLLSNPEIQPGENNI
jgi:hypothetical protein